MLKITPKNNQIEFKLTLENASLDKTKARLIVEVGKENTIIPLTVKADGKCEGDIPLKENWNNKEGKVKIEIIAENSYFSPFEKPVLFTDIPVSKTETPKKVTTPKPQVVPVTETKIISKPKPQRDSSLEDEISNFFKTK